MGGANSNELYDRFFAFWRTLPGWRAAGAVNHTSVGRRYLATGLVFFLIGGLLAMAIRSQLATAGGVELGNDTYNQLVTMHGTTMMFLFAVPVMEGFAIYLIPKMIGARDLPFPRLSAFSYWCYLFGGIFLYLSFLFDAAPDGGWFMYLPLNSKLFSPGMGADFWLLGVTFIEVSALSAAIELIVAILKTRAPGMSMGRMPLFAWYILVVAFMILFGFPPLILGSILLELERNFGFVFFDPERGGDPLLWQHLFWIFGHPEVYIIFLPAAGIVTMVVETFARRPVVGYAWVVAAVIATGFLSFGLWVHHMYTAGIPRLSLSFFSAASMAVAIPSGIQVFAWIATLWYGRPVMALPLLYVFGFLFTFVLGGLTGVMVALVPFDAQVHDTHFVVAHLHYVLFGGMVFPLIAGIYYWLPLLTGGNVSVGVGKIGFWLVFSGFQLTFLPMHLTGLVGMPRRVYTYPEGLGWEWLNLFSTAGGFLLAAGIAAVAVDLYLRFRLGENGKRNPWGAGTLEWGLRLPVPPFNFISIPPVTGRYPLWDQQGTIEASERGEHFLGDPSAARRETIGTSAGDATPEQVIRLPHQSWEPWWAAVAGIIALAGILAGRYWLSGLAGLALVAVFFVWAWRAAYRDSPRRIEAGAGLHLPNQSSSGQAPGLWGTRLALVSSAIVFASLLFAYYFLWTVSPPWPPSFLKVEATMNAPLLALLLPIAGTLILWIAVAANRRGAYRRFQLGLAVTFVLGAAYPFLMLGWLADAYPERGGHVYLSLVHFLHGYLWFHLFISLAAIGFAIARSWKGHIDSERRLEVDVATGLWHYAVGVALIVYAVVFVSPDLF
ncbi:cytochrome c oxidase subunit I [Thiohalomonas denitrificans]|uniref:cytochrome-c oxidase n=1 Tax=Thiohalomonas denitrificans TaxID=415747 RepID=A0A1G5QEP6_9GAMM|nr:cytochrome c oxidase subunit I [Thiohalomonas denitrificans]SCZ60333.1 cytochrome c oxidase subunit I+III [Thiohalomonas denitrificans]